MPLPPSSSTGFLKAKWVDSRGEPAVGYVLFSPVVPQILYGADNESVIGRQIKVDLDVQGRLAMVGVDVGGGEPGAEPLGWTWKVEEKFTGGGGESYYLDVPGGVVTDMILERPGVPASLGTSKGDKGDPGPPGGPAMSGSLALRPAASAVDENTLYGAIDDEGGRPWHRGATAIWRAIGAPVNVLSNLRQIRALGGSGIEASTATPGFIDLSRSGKRAGLLTGASNTTSESSMIGGVKTVNLAFDEILHFHIWWNHNQTTAATVNSTFRFKVSGVTLLTWIVGFSQHATARPCVLDVTIHPSSFIGSRPIADGTLRQGNPVAGADVATHTRVDSNQTVTVFDTYDFTVQHATANVGIGSAVGAAHHRITKVTV
jgi:hypothetical protein